MTAAFRSQKRQGMDFSQSFQREHDSTNTLISATKTRLGLLTFKTIKELTCDVWASQVVPVVKNPPANAGDIRDGGSIPGSGRSPGRGHGNPLQYSCLENPMGKGA